MLSGKFARLSLILAVPALFACASSPSVDDAESWAPEPLTALHAPNPDGAPAPVEIQKDSLITSSAAPQSSSGVPVITRCGPSFFEARVLSKVETRTRKLYRVRFLDESMGASTAPKASACAGELKDAHDLLRFKRVAKVNLDKKKRSRAERASIRVGDRIMYRHFNVSMPMTIVAIADAGRSGVFVQLENLVTERANGMKLNFFHDHEYIELNRILN